jgi:soluble lytic murein transglycosylase
MKSFSLVLTSFCLGLCVPAFVFAQDAAAADSRPPRKLPQKATMGEKPAQTTSRPTPFKLTTSKIPSSKGFLSEVLLTFPSKEKSMVTKKNKTPLARLKSEENNKNWVVCANLAQSQFASQKLIKDWLLLTWTHCVTKAVEDSHNPKLATAVLAAQEKNREVMLLGPARGQLFSGMVKLRLMIADIYGKQDSKAEVSTVRNNLDTLLSYDDRVDKESQAKALYDYADLVQNDHQLRAAKQLLEQSLSEKENHTAREKLNSVLLALGERPPDHSGDRNVVKPGEPAPELELPEAEKKAEDRLDQSSAANDLLTYVEDGVSYLNKYANGRRSKAVLERILEIYLQIVEHTNSADPEVQKFSELREKTLSLMEKAEATRQIEWARILHRRGEYVGALRLSEKCVSSFGKSPQVALALWVEGRSAQFLGQYDRAQKAFEQYIELNSGGDEFSEVLLRLSLVYVRQHQYSSAVATLQKLLLTKKLDRYELVARYWLVRSMQAENNSQAQAEAATLIEKFPFTYYGIRLRAEANHGVVEWPDSLRKSPDLSATYFLTRSQKQVYDRIQLLAQNDWIAEAQKEIVELPAVKDPLVKILLAQKWFAAKAFPIVIKLVSEAGDADPKLRSLDLIAVAYPKEFKEQVEREAAKNSLKPEFVMSLIRQESAFGIQAVSSSNAMGLMQLIPPTAMDMTQELHLNTISIPEDVFYPDINIQMGTYYIAKLIRRFGGNVALGLAAYNAGPSRLLSFVQGRPEVSAQIHSPSSDPMDEMWMDELPWYETSFYVKAILRNVLMYRTLEQPKMTLPAVIWADLTLPSSSGDSVKPTQGQ